MMAQDLIVLFVFCLFVFCLFFFFFVVVVVLFVVVFFFFFVFFVCGGGELFMNITNDILRLLKTVLKRTSLFRFVGH